MTDMKTALVNLIEQEADADLVRDMLAFAAERTMDLEIEARTGAPAGVRAPDRMNHRNGYRERAWDTRAGRIDLSIPKLRKGSYFPLGPPIDHMDRSFSIRPHFWSPVARPRRPSLL